MITVSSPTVAENIVKLSELSARALEWSGNHACRFDIDKFQLVHFTRNDKKLAGDTSLIVNGHEIKASEHAKYLGIVLDRRLRWREHVQKTVAKGTKTLLAVARLTRPTFGLPHKYVCQLYRSVVLPRVEYGLPVWYVPVRPGASSKRRTGSVGTSRQLGKLQRLASLLITGAFRSTPTDLLEYHAALPPVNLHLNRAVFNATARLAALPSHHPLSRSVSRYWGLYPRLHRSPPA